MDYRTAARPARRTLIVRNERLRTIVLNAVGGAAVVLGALLSFFLFVSTRGSLVFVVCMLAAGVASVRAIRRIRHARSVTEITIDGSRALVVRSDGSTHELTLENFDHADVESVSTRNPREGLFYRARIRLRDGNAIYVDTVGTSDHLHQLSIAESVGRFLRTD